MMEIEPLTLHRLHNHGIVDSAFARPKDVVSWFGAMQAQDFPHAKWAVGVRCPNATLADVERAVADRAIVRVWAMRGTLQLVAAEDVRWLVGLVGPRIITRLAKYDMRRFELNDKEFVKIEKVLNKVLSGTTLTRKEAYAALEQNGIKTDGQRGYHILARATLRGQLCFGAPSGKEETFALADEWLPNTKPLSREEAVAELALRYFRSHGPATLADYVWWSSLTVAEARAGLDAAKPHLTQDTFDGTTYWRPNAPSPAKRPTPDVHLLAAFDEYLLGYTDRSPILEKVHTPKAVTNNGILRATLVVDGQVAGTWTRNTGKGKVTLTTTVFASLPPRVQKAMTQAVGKYSAFLGTKVEIK